MGTDGIWCWPDKLEHYISAHEIILPEDFVKHALLNKVVEQEYKRTAEIDDSYWVTWSKRYTGKTPKICDGCYEKCSPEVKARTAELNRNSQ
jgi:hypothetical protein